MHGARWASAAAVIGLTLLCWRTPCRAAGGYDDRPPLQRAGYTAAAVVVNVVPFASAVVAPTCLPGYILCKLSFAGGSVIAAGWQLVLSGGSDVDQTRAILARGFGGDWIVTPRQVAGEAQVEPLPEPPPPAHRTDGSGKMPPPPL
jgi:hypothetical protein